MNEESTEILIPKKRFDEVNEKLKALREENKALTAEIQRLQKFESDFAEAKTTLDLKEIFVEAGFRKNEYEGIVCRISCPSREEKIALAKEIVKIKSFPDLGVAPAAIDVTSLADDVQKFIPGVKGMGAMEFVANYDEAQFAELTACENEELTYVIKINGVNYSLTGQHSALIAAGAVNAAVDMKIVVTPSSKIEKTA